MDYANLTEALNAAKPILPNAEYDIDLLRRVLQGEEGTPAQTNTLKRIVSQLSVKKSYGVKLSKALGQQITQLPVSYL